MHHEETLRVPSMIEKNKLDQQAERMWVDDSKRTSRKERMLDK